MSCRRRGESFQKRYDRLAEFVRQETGAQECVVCGVFFVPKRTPGPGFTPYTTKEGLNVAGAWVCAKDIPKFMRECVDEELYSGALHQIAMWMATSQRGPGSPPESLYKGGILTSTALIPGLSEYLRSPEWLRWLQRRAR